MSRQNYSYSTPAIPPRQTTNHGTSSAFSSSANPDEDWTQISDLAERRRIQNRIAQRNYRKKLKRRLEDLERRAGSSSASPPQLHAQLKQPPAKKQHTNIYKSPAVLSSSNRPRQKISPKVVPQSQYTPPMDHDNLFPSYDRDGSHTPPMFPYPQSYPHPDESVYPSYPHTQSYRPATTLHPTTDSFPDYLAPAPMTLPSMMHLNEALRRESLSSGDDAMNPFSMSYAAMAGLDMHAAPAYGDSNPHTPPLSHSFEHSAACSESGYPNYPSTPLSMPPSPPLLQHM